MLAYILAVLVGTGSVGLYLSAFFFPEIHRKHDFIWSGVGFFYALFLWIYARQETGGILVGQTASVALLGWFGWQTLKLRRQLVPVSQQTPIPSTTKLKQQLGLNQSAATTPKPTTPNLSPPPKNPAIRPSVSQESGSGAGNLPAPTHQIPAPPNADPGAEDQAWIKLEVKPAQAPTKPLGSAVQPPTIPSPTASNQQTPQSPAIIPETIAPNVPTDAIPTKARLDDAEDRQ